MEYFYYQTFFHIETGLCLVNHSLTTLAQGLITEIWGRGRNIEEAYLK